MEFMNRRSTVKCDVKLLNKELWQSFHALNTEMIITKPGRRMFPPIRIQVENLDPDKMYCFLVEMVPTGKCRYRYSASAGWAPAGSEEAQSSQRIYIHPESPARGHHWMTQVLSFGRLKLTNTLNAPQGHLVMSSMHKYQPRIIVAECMDVQQLHESLPGSAFIFPETQFIAVTAYQNDKMTKMKIDHNPFAKGFRESGQSMCKRKRQRMEQDRLEREQLPETKATVSNTSYQDSVIEHEDYIDVEDFSPSTEDKQLSPTSISDDSGFSDSEKHRFCNSQSSDIRLFTPTRRDYSSIASFSHVSPPLYFSYYHQFLDYRLRHFPQTYPIPYLSSTSSELDSLSHFESTNNDRVLPESDSFNNPVDVSPPNVSQLKSKKDDNHEGDNVEEKQNSPVKQSFTDFSIRAITGLV